MPRRSQRCHCSAGAAIRRRNGACDDGETRVFARAFRRLHDAACRVRAMGRGPVGRAHAALSSYDIAVFVSANAAEYGVPDPARWPPSLRVFAPGPGTAQALASVGLAHARIPITTFDSEGLLALPELRDVNGKRVLIFRGQS